MAQALVLRGTVGQRVARRHVAREQASQTRMKAVRELRRDPEARMRASAYVEVNENALSLIAGAP